MHKGKKEGDQSGEHILEMKSMKENKKVDSKKKKNHENLDLDDMLTCVIADILASIEVLAADWAGDKGGKSPHSILSH